MTTSRYADTNGNEWDTAEEALKEFIEDLPDLTDEETESVFQFTNREGTAAQNLAAIAHGVVYSGLSDRFEGDNYPVPERIDSEGSQS